MIFVNRNKVIAPKILIDENDRGFVETKKAVEYYGTMRNRPFEFKVYRDSSVKNALIKLFHGKCAYCDSIFLHVYPGDIEHFRPKGEIEDAAPNKKPGYYWLAAKWDNLLLSCRNCNQKLTHSLHGESEKKTMGKMNQFPLSDTTKYIRRHDHAVGVQAEEPFRLLINPCIDDPEQFLEYGEHGVIKPKKDEDGNYHLKGQTSIKVYVLQRVPLVQAREKLLISIFAQINKVKHAVINYDKHSTDGTSKFYFEKILKKELELLKNFLNPNEQFLGLARQVIAEFLRVNFNIVLKY